MLNIRSQQKYLAGEFFERDFSRATARRLKIKKQGYFVTREARPRGGYEVGVARCYGAHLFADDIDDVLVQENLKLLRQMHGKPALRQAEVL